MKSFIFYKHKLVLFMLVFFLPSCSGIVTYYQTKGLFYGQDSKSILKAFGSPAEKKIIGKNKEIYVYYVHSSIFDMLLNSERFPYIGFYPLNRTGKEFWIVMNGGQLESSGYAGDIGKYSSLQ